MLFGKLSGMPVKGGDLSFVYTKALEVLKGNLLNVPSAFATFEQQLLDEEQWVAPRAN